MHFARVIALLISWTSPFLPTSVDHTAPLPVSRTAGESCSSPGAVICSNHELLQCAPNSYSQLIWQMLKVC